MPLGVKALNTYPLKSAKRDKGLRDVPVSFAGVTVKPGDWVYADKASQTGGTGGRRRVGPVAATPQGSRVEVAGPLIRLPLRRPWPCAVACHAGRHHRLS